MIGRLGFLRPGVAPAALFVAILTLLTGCETATSPGPAPQPSSSGSNATARSETAGSAEETAETAGAVDGEEAAAGQRTASAVDVPEASGGSVEDAPPLSAPKVTEFDADAAEEEEDDIVVFGRDESEESGELPAREDLADESNVDSAVADATIPPAAEPPNYTVEIDALQVPTEGLVRMHPRYNVWVNRDTKQIIMSAEVCRREGALEMFACLKQTKEHESILSVYTEALIVHATLEALGVEPGRPVEFQPRYRPAEGREIEVTVFWRDDEGKIREARGQDWVRDIRTKETLTHPWVFAGSGFWENEATKERHYLAEYGDFICVSNFNSAMIDLPIESSQSEAGLLFEPCTERIPPLGSRVTLVLTPRPATLPADGGKDSTGIERHDL